MRIFKQIIGLPLAPESVEGYVVNFLDTGRTLTQHHSAEAAARLISAPPGAGRRVPAQRGEPVFVEVPAPTDDALQAVLHRIINRTMKLLTRRGALVEEQGSTTMADNDSDSDEARTLRPLQAAACTYRIAFGHAPAGRC